MKKKIITILLIIGVIFSILVSFILGFLLGVRYVRKENEQVRESLQDEMRQGNGVLLKIIEQSTMSEGENEGPDIFLIITVEYSGYTYLTDDKHHNSIVKMEDEDLLNIYSFCKNAYENGTFDDYSESVLDGSTYTYTFYDKDGTEHIIYDGYCYNNSELKGLREMIQSHYE